MIQRSCSRCGSLSLRADRSLAGRLVCRECGTPIDINPKSIFRPSGNKNFFRRKKYLIIVLVVIIILLALS